MTVLFVRLTSGISNSGGGGRVAAVEDEASEVPPLAVPDAVDAAGSVLQEVQLAVSRTASRTDRTRTLFFTDITPLSLICTEAIFYFLFADGFCASFSSYITRSPLKSQYTIVHFFIYICNIAALHSTVLKFLSIK